jgi:hypothetical protein
MNKDIISEELNNFKRLSGLLNESTRPAQWLAEFLGLMKSSTKKLPQALLQANEVKDMVKQGKLSLSTTKVITGIDWRKITQDEIEYLLQNWDEMFNTMREMIKQKKIPMDSAAVESYSGNWGKLARAYDEVHLTVGDAFKLGYKTPQAGAALLKSVVRNIPGGIGRYGRRHFKAMTREEMKKVWGWFITGVGDFNTVKQIFTRHGFPTTVANLSGQLFKKWVYWSAIFTASNFFFELGKDSLKGEEVYTSDIEAIWGRFTKAFELSPFGYVIPIVAIYDAIISPLLHGGVRGILMSDFNKHMEDTKNQAEKELDALERMKKTAEPQKGTGNDPQNY